eukprot:COSAG06_NODE_16272_length_1009_cov_6.249451_1_plen_208_part_00
MQPHGRVLYEAAEAGNLDKVRTAVDGGAPMEWVYRDGTSSVTIASLEGHKDVVALLRGCSDCRCTAVIRVGPLHLRAHVHGSLDLVEVASLRSLEQDDPLRLKHTPVTTAQTTAHRTDKNPDRVSERFSLASPVSSLSLAFPLPRREEQERAGAQNSCGRKLPSPPGICGAAKQADSGQRLALEPVCRRARALECVSSIESYTRKRQ